MDSVDLQDAEARQLAQFMDLGSDSDGLWSPGELAAVFRHQLESPVQFPFVDIGGQSAESVRAICSEAAPKIETFRDLFVHPKPPLELLRMTKDYAKACRAQGESPIPAEVATMLYVLSILVARTSRGQRITELNDQSLRQIAGWAAERPWIDEPIRQLLDAAQQVFSSGEPAIDA